MRLVGEKYVDGILDMYHLFLAAYIMPNLRGGEYGQLRTHGQVDVMHAMS